MYEIVYEIPLPKDSFLFYDAIGRLADAFARLALEDPTSECLSQGWNVSFADRKIIIPGGVYLVRDDDKRYYVFRSRSLKTVMCVYDPKSPIPFSCDIVDETVLEDIDEELVRVVF